MTESLNTAEGGPYRFSVDVACLNDPKSNSGLTADCSRLAHARVNRLMNMRTYNAVDFSAWWYSALVPALVVPRQVLGAGLGCWIDSRTNGTWNILPESAKDRVCALANQSIQEIDMFELRQGDARPGHSTNFPEPFWIPQLELFMSGAGCEARIPHQLRCPNATVGPASQSHIMNHSGAPSRFEMCFAIHTPRQVPYHEPTDNRCWFTIGHLSWAYRIPAPLVPGVPAKTRLEPSVKKVDPHCIYNTAVQADSWIMSGQDVGCCNSNGHRSNTSTCNVSCAEKECAAAHMYWKPENFSKHPYTCCTLPPTTPRSGETT